MASKFGVKQKDGTYEGTQPTVRQHEVEGYEVNLVIEGSGISIQKKGDKHRVKPTLVVSWGDILEIAAERQKARGELKREGEDTEYQSAYDFLGLDG